MSFLQNLINDVRLAIDDPDASAKFSDTEVLRQANITFRRAFRDIIAVSSRPYVVIFDLPINTTDTRYLLPPSIGEIMVMGEWNSSLGSYKWFYRTPSRWSPLRPGLYVSGNVLQFDRAPQRAYTLRIEYIPSGNVEPHLATVTAPSGLSSNQFALVSPSNQATGLTLGNIDDRANAYNGCVLRTWESSGSLQQVREHPIVSHTVDSSQPDATQRLITVEPNFSPAISSGTSYTYEILPLGWEGFRHVIVLGTAMTLAAMSGMAQRRAVLREEYVMAVRTEQMFEAFLSPSAGVWYTDTEEAFRMGMRGLYGAF